MTIVTVLKELNSTFLNFLKFTFRFLQRWYKQIQSIPEMDKQALRTTALADSQTFDGKMRHGFFSVPISTAIGDDGPYKTKLHPRNQTGKPVTLERKFQTSPTRSGQLVKSYLGPLNSLAATGKEDEFVEEPKRLMRQDAENRHKSKHEIEFFPSPCNKLIYKPSYTYKEETNPDKDPKRNRREDGRVKSKARQFQTNIQSRVVSDFFKPLKYVSDPIQRAHDMQWQLKKQASAKEAEAPFSPNKFTSGAFNSDKDLCNDHEIKRTRYFREAKFNITTHQTKWKDTHGNRKGLYGFFSPFPVYIESPPTEVTRKGKSSEKEAFKSMNRTTLGLPSSSIAQNPTNLRRTFNHSFSHRP